MLTEATTAVDATPRALMWTISQIAERDGVSKQAVSKKVKDLTAGHGLTVTRNEKGHVSTVNVAQYDHLRGKTDDPSKAQAPRRTAAPEPIDTSDTYEEALRQKTWHEAEKRRLELEEIKGNLLRVEKVRDAVDSCISDLVGTFLKLPNAADDLAAAVARDGVHGLRQELKRLAEEMQRDAATALARVADASRADAGALAAA